MYTPDGNSTYASIDSFIAPPTFATPKKEGQGGEKDTESKSGIRVLKSLVCTVAAFVRPCMRAFVNFCECTCVCMTSQT